MSIFQDPASLMQQARKQLQEKAVSKAQQKFMGMVYAAKQGEEPASPEVAKAAEGMSKKEAKKFAKTKHEGLPTHKEENEIEEGILDVFNRQKQQQVRQGTYHKDPKEKEGTIFSNVSKRNEMLRQLQNQSFEPEGEMVEAVEIINHLIENGYAETEQNALKIMENMSESWMEEIVEARRSEKEGKGSPESPLSYPGRKINKERGEKGGRHQYSGSQEYGGAAVERGRKKSDPQSQSQRLRRLATYPEQPGKYSKMQNKKRDLGSRFD